jgi:hypothetical protein
MSQNKCVLTIHSWIRVHSSVVPILKGLYTARLLYFHIFGLLLGISLSVATKHYPKQYSIDTWYYYMCLCMFWLLAVGNALSQSTITSDNTHLPLLYYCECNKIPPLWSSGHSSCLQIQRSWVRFPPQPDFPRSTESGTGSAKPREYNWGTTWKKK